MSDAQKNPSGTIFIASIVAAVMLMAIVLPFAIKDQPQPTAEIDPEDVNLRIQPVARLEIQPAGAALASTKPRDGATLFNTICSTCHNTGVAGAPKAGDKAAWAPRLAQGKEALYKNALVGKNAMPARGGGADLSDAEVKAAVDYLTGLAK